MTAAVPAHPLGGASLVLFAPRWEYAARVLAVQRAQRARRALGNPADAEPALLPDFHGFPGCGHDLGPHRGAPNEMVNERRLAPACLVQQLASDIGAAHGLSEIVEF
jgi:hypothetical protein